MARTKRAHQRHVTHKVSRMMAMLHRIKPANESMSKKSPAHGSRPAPPAEDDHMRFERLYSNRGSFR